MTNEITTTLEQSVAGLTPEAKALYNKYAFENKGGDTIPYIRINTKGDNGIAKGNIVLDFGGDETFNLGTEINLVILKQRIKYGYYSNKKKAVICETLEFDEYKGDIHILESGVYIRTMEYADFKNFKDNEYVEEGPDGKKKLLDWSFVLYVMIDDPRNPGTDLIAKMYLKSSSINGQDDKGKPNFDNPNVDSYIGFTGKNMLGTYKPLFTVVTNVTTEFKDGAIPYGIFKFNKNSDVTNIQPLIMERAKLEKTLANFEAFKIEEGNEKRKTPIKVENQTVDGIETVETEALNIFNA